MIDNMLLKKPEENTSNSDEVRQQLGIFISGISEEFIALQFDLDIRIVKDILKEVSFYDKPESMMGLKG